MSMHGDVYRAVGRALAGFTQARRARAVPATASRAA
jgi:hypothetical protein